MGLEVPPEVAALGIECVGWMRVLTFANLYQRTLSAGTQNQGVSSKPGDGDSDPVTIVAEATSPAKATEAVASCSMAKLGRILSASPDAMDVNLSLHTYGADSLIAVELRNWLMNNSRWKWWSFQYWARPCGFTTYNYSGSKQFLKIIQEHDADYSVLHA
ncbi:hypothetical protein DL768_008171 [Monosporascus sp. mg162]|nr:hypothetical protein DL768_008171 [Monosporascus sp. mg162]